MASYNKHNQFVEDMAEKVHNLGSDALTLALTNTAPTASNSVYGDLTSPVTTNIDSRTLSISSSAQSSGTYKLVIADKVMTATGAVSAFRYVDVYNDTPTSPADPLIGWYDYGSSVTLATSETFTVDFDGTNGFIQVA